MSQRRELTNDDLYFLDDYRYELHEPGSEHSMTLRESTTLQTHKLRLSALEQEMMRRGISREFHAFTRPLTRLEFETL
jgi:hypothetical protein